MSFYTRLLKLKSDGRLYNAISERLMPWQVGIRSLIYSKAKKKVSLVIPFPAIPDPADIQIVQRIFEAFKKAKADQPNKGNISFCFYCFGTLELLISFKLIVQFQWGLL